MPGGVRSVSVLALVSAAVALAAAASSTLTTFLVDGVPVSATDPGGSSTAVTTVQLGIIGSLVMSGVDKDYAYRPGYYATSAGLVQASSVFNVSSWRASGLRIASRYSGFNPIVVNGGTLELAGLRIDDNTSADGSDTLDFTGLGSAVAVFNGGTVGIKDSVIVTRGVAKDAVIVDSNSVVTLTRCNVTSHGGTLYKDYKNTPRFEVMVAPPWILGIMGSSRCTNMLGPYPTLNVIDSDMRAAQWAVLSLDSGRYHRLNIFNSKVSTTGADYALQQTNSDGTRLFNSTNPYTSRSGYGTYVIGSGAQYFYGATISVGTYTSIFTGGSATFKALSKGTAIGIVSAKGEALSSYTPAEDKVTIVSDTFGFMAHQETNTLVIAEGTEVTSEYATLLVKTGCDLTATVSGGSKLVARNGILVQLMDNDDTTTGIDSSQNFITTHTEAAGWPTSSASGKASAHTASITLTDITVSGDVYNGCGYYEQAATALKLKLSGGTVLTGAIAPTATIHVTYAGSRAIAAATVKASESWVSYQNTKFTISEYYDIGQVANMIHYNGHNTVSLTIEAGATWKVTSTSLLTSLSNSGTIIGNVTRNSDGTYTVEPLSSTATSSKAQLDSGESSGIASRRGSSTLMLVVVSIFSIAWSISM
eukprot:m51a1_g7363 hypothetical protein (647) ;mRNA; f:51345-53422